MITHLNSRHCEHSEAIQYFGLPRHPGSPHKGTPIHYVLKHVWNRMPRRFGPRDDGFSRGMPAFHSLPFASFVGKVL